MTIECRMVGGPLDGESITVAKMAAGPPLIINFPRLPEIHECVCVKCRNKNTDRYTLSRAAGNIAYYSPEVCRE